MEGSKKIVGYRIYVNDSDNVFHVDEDGRAIPEGDGSATYPYTTQAERRRRTEHALVSYRERYCRPGFWTYAYSVPVAEGEGG